MTEREELFEAAGRVSRRLREGWLTVIPDDVTILLMAIKRQLEAETPAHPAPALTALIEAANSFFHHQHGGPYEAASLDVLCSAAVAFAQEAAS